MTKDEALIMTIACGGSQAKAAELSGLSERTINRRMNDPTFRAKVDDARQELVRQAVGHLSSLGKKASDLLEALVDDPQEQGKTRLGAARAILEYMFKGHDFETLARRLESLEREIEELRRERGQSSPNPDPSATAGRQPDSSDPEHATEPTETGPDPANDPGRDDPGLVAEDTPGLFG